MCRWLLLVGEFDRREAYEPSDARNTAQWLSWRCGIDPSTAREHVRVARSLENLPLLTKAFSEGALSYSKVRAITRVATPATEADLVEMAHHASGAQLQRITGSFRRVKESIEGEGDEAYKRRYLRWSQDDDGTYLITVRLGAEEGESVVRAIEEATRRMRSATDHNAPGLRIPDLPPGEVMTDTAHLSDGLVAIARSFLSGGGAFKPGADREMVIHVDAQTLASDSEGRCELERGISISPETARRIACDCKIRALVVDPQGRPLSIGRKSRVVPRWLRRALTSRDGGCRFPGCGEATFIEAHHIRHWIEHGETALDNLLQLCFFHHRLVHEGGYSIMLLPSGEVEVRRANGTLIEAQSHTTKSYSADLSQQLARVGVAIKPDAVPEWSQQHVPLGDVVSGLFEIEELYEWRANASSN